MIRALTFTGILVGALLTSIPAGAHAFGQRYDLPIPLSMFVFGGAAAVALSFVIVGVFLRHRPSEHPRFNLLSTAVGKLIAHSTVIFSVRLFFVGVFLLILSAGYFGTQNPLQNFATVMVWVIAWVGLAFVCSLLGNAWALLNPWNTLFQWAEWLFGQATGGRRLSRDLPCPAWLGPWPAVILFGIFAWMEISWPGGAIPGNIAVALTVYSVITWTGMFLAGRQAWLERGEAFHIIFDLFSKFAITEFRVRPSGDREWNLRPPGVGLLTTSTPHPALMVFVLVLLATVTWDGFTETEQAKRLALEAFYLIQNIGRMAVPIVETAGLLSFPVIFVAGYLFFILLVSIAGGRIADFPVLARLFVFSIVPIAIAYHLSHYYSLLMIEGQLVIGRLSDPFGFGWDLFGTAAHKVDISVVNAKTVWFLSVGSIVFGHMVAVYLSHAEALKFYGDAKRALLSQIPMLVLMVGYTMISLWIVAQPIVS